MPGVWQFRAPPLSLKVFCALEACFSQLKGVNELTVYLASLAAMLSSREGIRAPSWVDGHSSTTIDRQVRDTIGLGFPSHAKILRLSMFLAVFLDANLVTPYVGLPLRTFQHSQSALLRIGICQGPISA